MYYFAYGSNMDIEQMKKRRCTFTSRELGILEGYSLIFNKASKNIGEGYANIIPKNNSIVYGAIYEVSEDSLRNLDIFEGVNSGHYYRKTLPLKKRNGKIVNVITYIACPEKVKNGINPTRKYLEHFIVSKDLLPTEYYAKFVETYKKTTL